MKQKPYHVNILAEVNRSIGYLIYLHNSDERLEMLMRFGDLLLSKLPKKEEDVFFIIENIIEGRNRIIKQDRFNNFIKGSDYLKSLVETIRTIFFKNLLIEILKEDKFVKIVLNNGTKVVITKELNAITNNFIAGKTPEGKNVEIEFSDIKLKGGILPVLEEKISDIKRKKTSYPQLLGDI